MLNTLRGIIRDGKVELLEHVNLPDGTKVLVTPLSDESQFWLDASQISLEAIWDNAEDDVYGQLLQE
jgi:hypothetical protein